VKAKRESESTQLTGVESVPAQGAPLSRSKP
jgi:hypothetical protein